MTLSPVFIGTIRSRLLIGLVPAFITIAIIIIELLTAYNIDSSDGYNVRSYFYPPIATGMLLIFSLVYIDIFLPWLVWSPPKSASRNNFSQTPRKS